MVRQHNFNVSFTFNTYMKKVYLFTILFATIWSLSAFQAKADRYLFNSTRGAQEMDIPSTKYYFSGSKVKLPAPVIKQKSKKKNEITDEANWFIKNELPYTKYHFNHVKNWFSLLRVEDLPLNIPLAFEDEDLWLMEAIKGKEANIYFYGYDHNSTNIMFITDTENSESPEIIDFSSFMMFNNWKLVLRWAVVENGILYVSTNHNTYSSSTNGINGFITAINLETKEIIWRSQPLVSNAENFIIHGDYIVSGYGFTNEKDYVYVLNKYTGEVMKKQSVSSGPDYIVEKDGLIYVRTYNTDYIFELK